MIEPRLYQIEAKNALFACWRKDKRAIPLISMPTGSGKAYEIALIIQSLRKFWPNYRVFVVSHVKEILEQNAKEIYALMQEPIGIYSSGLGQKTIRKITVAGVQSIYKKAKQFDCDMLIVDEVHRMNTQDNSMYKKLVDGLLERNPEMKVFGLSATCYRTDCGSLLANFFTEIAYDIPVRDLIEQGFLSNVISVPKGDLDFSDVEKSGYDYKSSALEEKMSPLVPEHCKVILESAKGRRSILVFCSGVKHSEDVAKFMRSLGETAEYVSGEMLSMQRDQILQRFKSGETRILCNCQILTTGFNYPALDCIALLRATTSTSLYVQIVGRGMRTAEGKKDCLVIDVGGNIVRFGPLDCIHVKIKNKHDVEPMCSPTKTCPECEAVWAIRVKVCANCGYEFPLSSMIENKPSAAPIISKSELWPVTNVHYKIHVKNEVRMLRIVYQSGMRQVSEFLCFDHKGYVQDMARRKWMKLGGKTAVNTSLQAFAHQGELIVPAEIEVARDGKYYKLLRITKVKKEVELEAGEPNIF